MKSASTEKQTAAGMSVKRLTVDFDVDLFRRIETFVFLRRQEEEPPPHTMADVCRIAVREYLDREQT